MIKFVICLYIPLTLLIAIYFFLFPLWIASLVTIFCSIQLFLFLFFFFVLLVGARRYLRDTFFARSMSERGKCDRRYRSPLILPLTAYVRVYFFLFSTTTATTMLSSVYWFFLYFLLLFSHSIAEGRQRGWMLSMLFFGRKKRRGKQEEEEEKKEEKDRKVRKNGGSYSLYSPASEDLSFQYLQAMFGSS